MNEKDFLKKFGDSFKSDICYYVHKGKVVIDVDSMRENIEYFMSELEGATE